jgi:F-type H+-transporting ATPase subunit b
MSEEAATTHTTVEVPASGEAHGGDPTADLLKPDPILIGLTWLTFALLAIILYKVAWKPILAALDKREQDIRKAIEDAARTREELAQIDAKRRDILGEADAKAKEIVDTARKAAVDAAQAIESKAREEAQILIQNAQREISAAETRALAALRKESADMAVNLARKIIGANLDAERSRRVTDEFIQKL